MGIYRDFTKQAGSDKAANLALLYQLVAAHPSKVTAPRPGAEQYWLHSQGTDARGRMTLQATKANGTVAISLLREADATAGGKGLAFSGDTTDRVFLQALEQAFD